MNVNRAIPAGLVLALAVSWVAKSNDGFKLSLTGLIFYGLWRGVSAAGKALAARRRRRELARMPVFSLHGETLAIGWGPTVDPMM